MFQTILTYIVVFYVGVQWGEPLIKGTKDSIKYVWSLLGGVLGW